MPLCFLIDFSLSLFSEYFENCLCWTHSNNNLSNLSEGLTTKNSSSKREVYKKNRRHVVLLLLWGLCDLVPDKDLFKM